MTDDITPAPVPGESIEQYRRRMSTAILAQPAHLDPEKSRLSMPLLRAFIIAAGLVAGGVTTGMSYRDLTTTVGALQGQLAELRSLAAKLEARLPDVRTDAAREAARALRVRMHGARIRLRCEARARPDGQRDCEMSWPVETE